MTNDEIVAFTKACIPESAAIHLMFLCFPLHQEKDLGSKRFHNSGDALSDTTVKRKSMRNALVPGRRPRKFPALKFN